MITITSLANASLRLLPILALLALTLTACGTVEPADGDDPIADAGPDAAPEPDPEPEPDPDPEPEPLTGCDAFCAEDGLRTVNSCFVDPGDELDRETCLVICEDEGYADAGACVHAAESDCDAAEACFPADDDDPVTFEVDGPDAIMRGVIDARIVETVRELIAGHPEVERIVMIDCPGSDDDDSNLVASRLVREAGLNTHVPANGVIASGAVDFFIAGVGRTADVAGGARLGVHSWAGNGVSGADLPRDHPEHRRYLDYYAEMGIPADFYWFTLDAAPVESIHFMTVEEVERYGLVTAP